MKRQWAIVLLSVTAACSERVEKPNDSVARISFSAPALNSARGTAINTPALMAQAQGFDVWAYTGTWGVDTPVALLNGVSVTSPDHGATWSYDSPVKWPDNNANVTFFAYAPANSATVTYLTDNTPLIQYTVPAAVAQHKDLMIANPLYDQNGLDYFPTVRKVDLYFRHALSQIGFSACYAGTRDGVVKLTGVALRNVYGSGTTPMTTDPVSWTPGVQTADYALSVDGATMNPLTLAAQPQKVTGSGSLFLIPQAVDPQRIELEASFEVDGGKLSYSSPIALPAAWEPGKSYEYQITLEDGAIQVIVIDSEIAMDDWSHSIILQAVMLTSDPQIDLANINSALSILNGVANLGSGASYPYFGIYGVNDVNHDLTIDIGSLGLNNFAPGKYLLFDFKKTIRSWGTDTGDQPWTIKVTGYESDWNLMPAQQNLAVDATSGATTAGSAAITARGSIILQRK